MRSNRDQYRDGRLACYRPREVELLLRAGIGSLESKRWYELLCGTVLARCRQQLESTATVLVGLELAPGQGIDDIEKPDLGTLLQRFRLLDRDADVGVVSCYPDDSHTLMRIQVVRAMDRYSMLPALQQLEAVLDKKLRVPDDPLLALVVMCDLDLQAREDDLRRLVDGKRIPYGRIGVVAQTGPREDQVPEQYGYFELFPDFAVAATVDLEGFK